MVFALHHGLFRNVFGKGEFQMKSLTRVLLFIFCFAAVIALVVTSCSDSRLNQPGVSTNGSTNDILDDNDEQGPPPEQGGEDEYQLNHFTFDDAEPVQLTSKDTLIGFQSVTLNFSVDGRDRNFVFPDGFMPAYDDVLVNVRDGVNWEGENLEIYDLQPEYLAYRDPFILEFETGLTTPAETWMKADFSLYKALGGTYVFVEKGTIESDGMVRFELSGATSYAVISIVEKFTGTNPQMK